MKRTSISSHATPGRANGGSQAPPREGAGSLYKNGSIWTIGIVNLAQYTFCVYLPTHQG